jgi:hypothetical protein
VAVDDDIDVTADGGPRVRASSCQAVQMNIHAEFSSAHTQLARGGRGRGVKWSSGSATGSKSEAQPSQKDCSDATLRTMRSAVRLVLCRLFKLAPLGSSRGSTADDRIEPSSAGRAGGGRRPLVRPYRGRVASRWIPEAGPASSRTRRTFGISTTTVCALHWTDSCERKQPFRTAVGAAASRPTRVARCQRLIAAT